MIVFSYSSILYLACVPVNSKSENKTSATGADGLAFVFVLSLSGRFSFFGVLFLCLPFFPSPFASETSALTFGGATVPRCRRSLRLGIVRFKMGTWEYVVSGNTASNAGSAFGFFAVRFFFFARGGGGGFSSLSEQLVSSHTGERAFLFRVCFFAAGSRSWKSRSESIVSIRVCFFTAGGGRRG